MLRSRHVGTVIVLGLIAEIVAFVAAVDWLGLGPVLLIGLGSTLLGFSRLRLIGASAFHRLRAAAAGRVAREDAFLDGALEALGAVLLILPGFVTDAIGLTLLAPSMRERIRRRVTGGALGASQAGGGARTIDLEATDWSRLDRGRPT